MARDIHAQSIPLPKFPVSAFDMGYSLKTSCFMGALTPHYIEECIPGDICHIKTDLFCRLDPMIFPIMHRVKVRQNFFFVPDRLVLGDEMTEDFFSCKDMSLHLPGFYVPPTNPSIGSNSIFDYMECQPRIDNTNSLYVRNPLPFLMYQIIYKDWYADEIIQATAIQDIDNLISYYQSIGFNQMSSISTYNPFTLRYVDFSKDRFTSAQPDAQRVGEVYLMNPLQLERVDGGVMANTGLSANSSGTVYASSIATNPSLRASLTIDELWDEMAVQRFLNSMNEFGNERYTEILAGQYGVLSADARLQRPQWLGGNEMTVNISEVLQTSETTSSSPLGAYSGRGIVAGNGRDIAFKVPEHGFILGLLSFVPENGYASGSPRWLYKQSPLDFAYPRFNNLGEQAVLNGELYSDHLSTGSTNDLSEFGYQPQYDEYRSHPSRSVGDFRSGSFLAWHLDRKFTSVPGLNSGFLQVTPGDTSRIFDDTDPNNPHIHVHAFHKSMYVRPISKHPVPGKL